MDVAMRAFGDALTARETGEFCEKHGTAMLTHYNSHTKQDEVYCPDCQMEKLAEIQAKFDKKAQAEMQKRRFKELSLVNSQMWGCTFDNFVAPDGSPEQVMLKLVQNATASYEKAGLMAHNTVLFGTPGAGKSHLAMAMMQEIHKKTSQSMAFVNVSLLFSRIKDSFDNPAQFWTRDKAVKVLTSVDLLCLDDLGTESSMGRQGQEAAKWAQDVIYDILEGQSRVIITTNLDERQLRRVYDAKIFSRIFRNSDRTRFSFNGIQDKRLSPVKMPPKEEINGQQHTQNRGKNLQNYAVR